MNEVAETTWDTPGAGKTVWLPAALLVLLSLLTVAATVFGNGNVVVALVPVLAVIGGILLWKLPLRYPLMLLVFIGLAIDASGEGPWEWWGSEIGKFLHVYLALVVPGSGIPFPASAVLLFVLLAVHIHRSLAGAQVDVASRAPTAHVLLQGLMVSALAVLMLCALGYKNGGDMKMAKVQVQWFVEVLLMAYLAARSLRGMRDYRMLGIILIVSACIKAVIAIYVKKVAMASVALEYATSHGDSLTFAAATVLVIIKLVEQPDRRAMLLCAFTLPLLTLGMIANDRRLVWVQILAALFAFWGVSRRSHFKLFIARAMIAAIPLVIVYVAAGWNSNAEMFSPVKTLRSVGDSEADASTLYRDLENYNLLATLRPNLLTGSGFGHPFVEEVKLPDISFFKEYRYLPHNSVLGLWAFCGPLGFSGLMAALVVAVFLAARSYQFARTADERIAATMAISCVIIFLIHCWGDIGFTERKSVCLLGPALAIAGQLAVSTGAWRVRPVRRG